jgi:hypothetical protein
MDAERYSNWLDVIFPRDEAVYMLYVNINGEGDELRMFLT